MKKEVQEDNINTSGRILERTVYRAATDRPLPLGRVHTVILGYFARESDAKRAASGKGPMGTDGNVQAETRLVLEVRDSTKGVVSHMFLLGTEVHMSYKSPKETLESAKRKLRAAKLTSEELDALGIKG